MAPGALAFAPSSTTVRGALIDGPALRRASGAPVSLHGDEPTMLVLNDKRLTGADFEAAGQFKAPAQFEIDPIHTHALFVYRNSKKLLVSYWCDICYIRTWSPGKCWCCQQETRLDPVDPATLDDKNK
jgi:hypothetical protein